MEKLKESFQLLLKDKKKLFEVSFHVVIGFLFYLGLFMAFMKDTALIKGRLSLAELPGSFVFELIIFASIFAYIYFKLIDQEKRARQVLLVQFLTGLIFHLYGALIMRVGSEGSATGGFGRTLLFILLVLMAVSYFKPKLLDSIISKYIIKEPQTEEVKITE